MRISQMMEILKSKVSNVNLQYNSMSLIYASLLTFGVKALSDPVFPKHNIHPLPMATHKQPHLGQGGLTSWPCHLRSRFVAQC